MKLPRDPEEITPEFLARALAAPVAGRTVEQIGEGAGFVGRVVRLRLQYSSGTGPETVIAKFPAATAGLRGLFQRFGLHEREVRFYQELQADTPVPTPRCYLAQADPATGDFLLLLEDLAPAITGNPLVPTSPAACTRALTLAAAMHARWWNDPRITGSAWLPGPDAARMKAMIAERYEAAWASFESRFGKHLPSPLVRLGRRLGEALPRVLERLAASPATLVHGDFQPANIFYSANGEIVAVGDWQVIVRARPAMDVAYFLVNAMDPAERRMSERGLLQEYLDALRAAGVNTYTAKELWEDYRLGVLSQFGLVVVLSHALAAEGSAARDAAAEALAGVVGARLIAAMTDLRPQEILDGPPLWRRISLIARR